MEVLFDTVLLLFRLHSTENKHASPVGGDKVREERPEHVQWAYFPLVVGLQRKVVDPGSVLLIDGSNLPQTIEADFFYL